MRHALLALLLLASPLRVHAQADAPPADFAARVAQVVAARWGVDAAVVRVQLASERAVWPAPETRFEVQSAAADGTFVLSFDGAAAATRPLVVRAGMAASSPVAARDLARGETLTAADIALQSDIAWGPPRAPDAGVAEGWSVRRRIAQGEPLRSPAVAPPVAIRAGEQVRIILVRAGITIALNGRAAGQAGIGERVAARADTGRRLEGVATAPGVITIEAPGRDLP